MCNGPEHEQAGALDGQKFIYCRLSGSAYVLNASIDPLMRHPRGLPVSTSGSLDSSLVKHLGSHRPRMLSRESVIRACCAVTDVIEVVSVRYFLAISEDRIRQL